MLECQLGQNGKESLHEFINHDLFLSIITSKQFTDSIQNFTLILNCAIEAYTINGLILLIEAFNCLKLAWSKHPNSP